MSRYIDADKIEWRLIIPTNATTAEENMIYHARKLVEFQKTADVVPVVHGEWIYDGVVTRCSNCGDIEEFEDCQRWDSNYCPNCGSRMDGEK